MLGELSHRAPAKHGSAQLTKQSLLSISAVQLLKISSLVSIIGIYVLFNFVPEL